MLRWHGFNLFKRLSEFFSSVNQFDWLWKCIVINSFWIPLGCCKTIKSGDFWFWLLLMKLHMFCYLKSCAMCSSFAYIVFERKNSIKQIIRCKTQFSSDPQNILAAALTFVRILVHFLRFNIFGWKISLFFFRIFQWKRRKWVNLKNCVILKCNFAVDRNSVLVLFWLWFTRIFRFWWHHTHTILWLLIWYNVTHTETDKPWNSWKQKL